MKSQQFKSEQVLYKKLLHSYKPREKKHNIYKRPYIRRMAFQSIHAINDTAMSANESDDNSGVKAIGTTVDHTTNTVQHVAQKKYIKKSYAKQFRKKLTEKAGAALQKTVRHTGNIIKRTVVMLVKRPDIAVTVISILVLISLFYTITAMGVSVFSGVVAVISGESQTEQIEESTENYSNVIE